MIVGDNLRLRAIERTDLALLAEWRNDADVYRHFLEHEPLSLAMQESWFESFLQRRDEKYWIAETRNDSQPLGTIALIDVNWRSRRAELGRVLIYPAAQRRRGYSGEMCRLALDYAFDHMNLNRISLEVFADNEPAIALYRKLGFREEGCLRQYVFNAGAYRDVLLFSLLRDDLPPQST